jgi:RNA polymerase sigma-70 factor (ECF subfamily)
MGPTSTSWTLLRKICAPASDASAWEVFARRYGPAVFRWCRQWGLQEADADDVTQDVLLKLVEHMKKFEYDPRRSFRKWLKMVAYHAWAKAVADRSRTRAEAEGVLDHIEAREDLVARLEEEYDRELLDLAMVRVAQRVEQHTWEAFRFLALEGLSGAEAAKRLNMRVATVYVARSKVQRMIREQMRAVEQENDATAEV